ncbi:MAG: porin family protein [Myxococcota bacterium]
MQRFIEPEQAAGIRGRTDRKTRGGRPLRKTAAIVVALSWSLAGTAASQEAAEVEAAAETADQAVEEIEAILERLRRTGGTADAASSESGEEAAEAAASPPASTDAEAAAPTEAEDPTLQEAIERAEASAERAEDAAWEARRKAEEVQAALEAFRNRYARTGPYVGAAGLYALENFDTPDFAVDDSRGVAVFAGWRVHPHIAIEARGEILQGFDARAKETTTALQTATLDGFLVTAGPKFYALTGAFQPYAGVGFGAFSAEIDGVFDDGSTATDQITEAVVRPAAGIDYYLSEHLVVNLEAAYVAPGGDLDGLDFGLISAGLSLRF